LGHDAGQSLGDPFARTLLCMRGQGTVGNRAWCADFN